MQSFLLVVCIIVLHDSVWIMVTLVYDAKEQKWPLYRATERSESKAGQRAQFGDQIMIVKSGHAQPSDRLRSLAL